MKILVVAPDQRSVGIEERSRRTHLTPEEFPLESHPICQIKRSIAMRTSGPPRARVLGRAVGVVGRAQAVLDVVLVLAHVALAVGKHFHPVPVPHPALKESRVPVAVDHGEDAVAVLEAVEELAHVLVAVVVERGAVARLQAVHPVADVGASLAEECADAWRKRGKNLI